MSRTWKSLLFETLELGVSSAVAPELLPDNQAAWGMNVDVRGGKPATRPNLRNLGNLPNGLIQGCEYFGVQNGMLVASINGVMYRLRIGINSITVEEIPLTFRNSAIIKQVWMTQTVETLVIQDGQSNPILYNGAVANRAVTGQVPRGRQMAYGNGRLWVAVNANEIAAGDIRTSAAGSELNFTEETYLTGGGRLFFGSPITGMAFIPVTGQSDYGALLVYGARETNAIRADITTRDDWAKVPSFVSSILRSVGAAAQWSIVSVNQDLYWRDSNGGIRSIRNALADEAGPGSAPISREVSRLTDFDSQQLLSFCSGVYFNNRLLLTSSPFLLPNGGVAWKNLISLDFAPLSTMGAKSQPAYNGKWSGLNFVKLVGGEFNGKNRSFALTTDDDGNNQLWEFDSGSRADQPVDCTDGTADPQAFEYPIQCFVEYPLRNFGESKRRKRLDRCDVWLTAVDGEVALKVYWRSDNSVKWNLWDEASTCAQTTDPSETAPHVWKNLVSQERPQFKTFTIPDSVNDVVKYANQVGFEFQIRLAWEGRCRIHRVMLHGELLDDPDYADRSGFEVECVEQDVTGNQIIYAVPTDGCPAFIIRFGDTVVRRGTIVHLGPSGPTVFTFCNTSPSPITGFRINVIPFCSGQFILSSPPPSTVGIGECVNFTVTSVPTACPNPTGVVQVVINDVPVFSFPVDDESAGVAPEITSEPEPTCVEDGESASFAVTATGTAPLEYDWFESTDGGENWNEIADGGIYSGANTATLTINPAGTGMNNYMYRCRVRNTHGSVTSNEVTLTVGDCVLTGCFLPWEDSDSKSHYECLVGVDSQGPGSVLPVVDSFSTDLSETNKITCTFQITQPTSDFGHFSLFWFSFATGGDITVTFFGSMTDPGDAPDFVADVLDDDGNVVITFGGSGAPFPMSGSSSGLPAGRYRLRVRGPYMPSGVGDPNNVFSGILAVYGLALVFNPIVLGNGSGPEGCPKMLLPPLTESTGETYPSCTDAATDLADALKVSNCVGYCENATDTFTATDGGSNLSLNATKSAGDVDPRYTMWGSVNAVAGKTLSAAFSYVNDAGAPTAGFTVYDDTGTQIFLGSAAGGTIVSSALPYTGRYIIRAAGGRNDGVSTASFAITALIASSGTLSVNPIQALYDVGLGCPGRLDCGDACPTGPA